MPRQGLDRERVVGAAAAIADGEGLEAVTLARVAGELGVRTPSLYNHVDGRDGLMHGIAVRGVNELTEALRSASMGRSGVDALVAVARAQRDYARAHPGRYALAMRAPDRGDGDEHAAAAARAVEALEAVLRPWGLEGDDAVHAIRALRSAVHGFVALEQAGGFGMPVDLDASFDHLVAVLSAGLTARSSLAS